VFIHLAPCSFILVLRLMSGEQTPDMATCISFELYKNKKCMVFISSTSKFFKTFEVLPNRSPES
jgi:hypothetical protein